MKFAYCGFDFFSECLKACLEEGHELLMAFSQEVDGEYNSNGFVRKLCDEHGAALRIGKISEQDIRELSAKGCSLLVSAAYAYRVPAIEIDRSGIRGVNVHPSLLPDGRGPWPLPHIILKNLPRGGVTIHKLAHEFDSGDILTQGDFAIAADENLETLSCKTQMLAARLLGSLLKDLEQKWVTAKPQGSGSYWGIPDERERSLDWTKPVAHIHAVVRAFGKFESWANFDGRDWLVQDASVWHEKHSLSCGVVVHRTNREVVIAARDGFVCLRQFRPEQP